MRGKILGVILMVSGLMGGWISAPRAAALKRLIFSKHVINAFTYPPDSLAIDNPNAQAVTVDSIRVTSRRYMVPTGFTVDNGSTNTTSMFLMLDWDTLGLSRNIDSLHGIGYKQGFSVKPKSRAFLGHIRVEPCVCKVAAVGTPPLSSDSMTYTFHFHYGQDWDSMDVFFNRFPISISKPVRARPETAAGPLQGKAFNALGIPDGTGAQRLFFRVFRRD